MYEEDYITYRTVFDAIGSVIPGVGNDESCGRSGLNLLVISQSGVRRSSLRLATGAGFVRLWQEGEIRSGGRGEISSKHDTVFKEIRKWQSSYGNYHNKQYARSLL